MASNKKFDPNAGGSGRRTDLEVATTIPKGAKLEDITLSISASSLSSIFEDILEDNMGIKEIDSIYMCPDRKNGLIQGMEVIGYFGANDPGSRIHSINGNSNGQFAGSKRSFKSMINNGYTKEKCEFVADDSFIRNIAAIAYLDNNGKLAISKPYVPKDDMSEKEYRNQMNRIRNIAMINLDFLALCSIWMGLSSDTMVNYDFVGCEVINNGRNNGLTDYKLSFAKYLTPSGGKKNKSRINYDMYNKRFSDAHNR